jgi:nucleotide-binding universal stress UspA family protein
VTHISRILVAIDFSEPARAAFDHALALARQHGAELIAVQAVPTGETFARSARARLTLTEKLRARVARAGVEFSHRIQTGDPAEIVLLHARSLRPDVIVVGSHQRRGLDRLRAGSIAERIAAGATAPVILVPGGRLGAAPAAIRHVAVAVDFSEGSSRAIDEALALATDPTDRITLIHVLPGSRSSVPRHLHGYGLDVHEDAAIRDVRRRLHDAVPAHRRSQAIVGTQVGRGDAAKEIAQIAENVGADLLIVAATRRGLVSRALFGSTTARLLRTTRVPVLVVRDRATARADEADADRRLAA